MAIFKPLTKQYTEGKENLKSECSHTGHFLKQAIKLNFKILILDQGILKIQNQLNLVQCIALIKRINCKTCHKSSQKR